MIGDLTSKTVEARRQWIGILKNAVENKKTFNLNLKFYIQQKYPLRMEVEQMVLNSFFF